MSNSPLANLTILSPNYTKGRNGNKIDTITVHHCAGIMTAKQIGNLFARPSRNASCNYGIGNDGQIVLVVDEANRSWCTGSAANDRRAITIEVSNSTGAPNWEVSDAAMTSLCKLLADICRRNGIASLKWLNDKSKIGKVDEQNMTVHRWFQATACPGPYLMNKMSYIAQRTNTLIAAEETSSNPSPVVAPKKSNEEIAREVLKGLWGNGQERKNRLTAAGYDYNAVQSIVNLIKNQAPASDPKYYTVQKGDTASGIAKKSGITLTQLKKLNPSQKNWNLIYPGQKFRIK